MTKNIYVIYVFPGSVIIHYGVSGNRTKNIPTQNNILSIFVFLYTWKSFLENGLAF